MSAGTGIRHSRVQPSSTERLHLYQIWIMPEEMALRRVMNSVASMPCRANSWCSRRMREMVR